MDHVLELTIRYNLLNFMNKKIIPKPENDNVIKDLKEYGIEISTLSDPVLNENFIAILDETNEDETDYKIIYSSIKSLNLEKKFIMIGLPENIFLQIDKEISVFKINIIIPDSIKKQYDVSSNTVSLFMGVILLRKNINKCILGIDSYINISNSIIKKLNSS